MQQAFFQRASKDGVTQRGERIVLFWVTGREELRRTSARTKNTFFQLFSGRRRGPYILVYFAKTIRFLFFCVAHTKKSTKQWGQTRRRKTRAETKRCCTIPVRKRDTESWSVSSTPSPIRGDTPTATMPQEGFSGKTRVRVRANVFIVDY